MQVQDLILQPLGSLANNRISDASESNVSSPEEQVIKLRARRTKQPSLDIAKANLVKDIAYILTTRVSPVKPKSRDIASEYFEQSSPTPKKRKRSEIFANDSSDSNTSGKVVPNVTANESHHSNGLHVRRRLAFRKRLALKTPDTSISPYSLRPTKSRVKTAPSNHTGHRI